MVSSVGPGTHSTEYLSVFSLCAGTMVVPMGIGRITSGRVMGKSDRRGSCFWHKKRRVYLVYTQTLRDEMVVRVHNQEREIVQYLFVAAG